MFGGCVAAGGTGNIVQIEIRMDSTKYQERHIFKDQSRCWSWWEVGHWAFQQDNDLNHTSKSTMKYLQERPLEKWPLQFPDLNIIESMWRNLKHAVHGKVKEYFWSDSLRCLQEVFTSCYSPRRSYKVLIDRVPKLLHRAFFLFLLFWKCKKKKWNKGNLSVKL